MIQYRVIECTKGVHTWYELETWEPTWLGFGKFKWQSVTRGDVDPWRFFTKQEAIQFADQEYAVEHRNVVEESK